LNLKPQSLLSFGIILLCWVLLDGFSGFQGFDGFDGFALSKTQVIPSESNNFLAICAVEIITDELGEFAISLLVL
jgi:hypothetical protein